jgi:ribonuclease T1
LWIAAALALTLLAACGGGAPAEPRPPGAAADMRVTARDDAQADRTGEISVTRLPREALDTLRLIRSRGPFPYKKDGTVFGNREKRLPLRPRGYYTEYTVRTPGSGDRGARRIVAGQGATGDPATGGEYWYTDDHYESFRRIRDVPAQ